MSMSAMPIGRPSRRAPARSPPASSPTSAPWFSSPVSGSRRVASTRATVWRLIRPCADRKTRNRATAATIAAVSVDHHDRLPEPVELGEDRHRVTPDPDDRLDLAVGLEREVLAQHARRRERQARLPR